MEGKKHYNPTFSIMKGIAIISVVVGHAVSNEMKGVELFVNQYHLAVFFFVAGYFIQNHIWKKIKSLYFPFVVAGMICILLHNVFVGMHIIDGEITISDMLKDSVTLLVGFVSKEQMMGAMWFCPALMISSIVFISFNMLIGKSRPIWQKVLVLCCPVVIGTICLHVLHLKSPYCIWQNMIVCGVMLEGWLFRKLTDTWRINRKYVCIMFLVSLALLLLFFYNGLYANLQANGINQENVIVVLFVALCGCLCVYGGGRIIGEIFKNRWVANAFQLAGEHSFSIMLLHFLCFKVVSLVMCGVYQMPIDNISQFPVIQYSNMMWFVAYVVIGSYLPVGLAIVYNRMRTMIWSGL